MTETDPRLPGDADARRSVEGRAVPEAAGAEAGASRSASPAPDPPPAGPHAREELMNPDATPGTGMLPPVGTTDDPNMQASS